ncbi:MAG: rod shape-determining protein MreC [Ezakiella sp.]|nr:rod shape-determining protein MreC [Ezakiella sp.]
MEFRNKNINKIIIFAIFAILIAIIFFAPSLEKSQSKIANFIGRVFSPASRFFRDIGIKVNDRIEESLSTQDANELENLKIRVSVLEDENRRLSDVIARSDALKMEYEMIKNANQKLIKANITSRAPGTWFDLFTIDIGKEDGVDEGDSVVVAAGDEEATIGLVGKVSSVNDNNANVITIMADSNKIAFRTIRSTDGGIIGGIEGDLLKGYMYDRNADIIAGDKIITSGLGEVYKESIFIGTVDRVENDETMLRKNIYIKPAVDVKKLMRVYIVK